MSRVHAAAGAGQPVQKALTERQAAKDFYAARNAKARYTGIRRLQATSKVRSSRRSVASARIASGRTRRRSRLAVEHYRPKGEVTIDGKRTPPGYWWLASSWEEPAALVHRLQQPAAGRTFPAGCRPPAGKANAFPLADPEKRRRAAPAG